MQHPPTTTWGSVQCQAVGDFILKQKGSRYLIIPPLPPNTPLHLWAFEPLLPFPASLVSLDLDHDEGQWKLLKTCTQTVTEFICSSEYCSEG